MPRTEADVRPTSVARSSLRMVKDTAKSFTIGDVSADNAYATDDAVVFARLAEHGKAQRAKFMLHPAVAEIGPLT